MAVPGSNGEVAWCDAWPGKTNSMTDYKSLTDILVEWESGNPVQTAMI